MRVKSILLGKVAQTIYIGLLILLSAVFISIHPIWAQTASVFVSSTTTFPDWGSEHLNDGNLYTCWSSDLHSDSNHEEWAGFNLGEIRIIDQFSINFRSTQYSTVNNVPEYFVLQYTTADDNNWTDIPIHRYTADYPAGTSNIPYPETKTANVFSFEPIFARKIRIKAMKLRQDGSNNFSLQICEIALHESSVDAQRLYTSLGGQFDADMNNFYHIKTLAKNQKNYSNCSGSAPDIGARLDWGIANSGEGAAWLRKMVWDGNYQRRLLDNAVQLPVTDGVNPINPGAPTPTPIKTPPPGLVWNTADYIGHLGHEWGWPFESNAHYILSVWDYLSWSGNTKALTEVGDRTIRVKRPDGSWNIYNDQADYAHRLGVFHNIGQSFVTTEPISEISIRIYALPQSMTYTSCNGQTITYQSNFEIKVVDSSGKTVADQTYNGIDDCGDGMCDGLAWVSIRKSDGTNFNPGNYQVTLRNLGNPAGDTNPYNLSFWKSRVGWLSSFDNKFGPSGDTSQAAMVNGVATSLLTNLRLAMDYQLNQLHGGNGILIIDDSSFYGSSHQGNRDNLGLKEGSANLPSNWWDLIRFGYKDAKINTFYYGSLAAMANIEEMEGDQVRANHLRNEVMPRVKSSFNQEFWDSTLGRYVSWIGRGGERFDLGHTDINLQAIYYGLADNERTQSIMSWISGTRIVSGDQSQGEDIYHFNFAPRTNTRSIESFGFPYPMIGDDYQQGKDPANWYWAIKQDGSGRGNFGKWEQNGGTELFFSYYDILSRFKSLSPDNAWDRFRTFMSEYHKDGFYRKNETDAEWQAGYITGLLSSPDAGLPILAFLEGFLGVEAKVDGLHIKPNLPSSLTFLGVKNISHWGNNYSIKADRNVSQSSINTLGPNNYEVIIPADGEVIVVNGQIRSLQFYVGWNRIIWPNLIGETFGEAPSGCFLESENNQSWFNPYARGYLPINTPLIPSKTYFFSCRSPGQW